MNRRTIVGLTGTALTMGVAGCFDTDETDRQSETSGWSTFKYDAMNTGHAPGETGPKRGTEAWTYSTEGAIRATPAVVNDTVYVGCREGGLYAVAAEDGDELWTFETSAAVTAPTVAAGSVYVGTHDGVVYALAADGGDDRWQFETAGDVRSGVAVSDGVVYVGCTDGIVYALDGSDGETLWTWDSESTPGIFNSPAVATGTVYAVSRSAVHALDQTDGTEQWSFEADHPLSGAPTVADERVYVVGGDGDGYALDATDGTIEWTFDVPAQTVSVADGTIYVGSREYIGDTDADRHGGVYALDADDGSLQWAVETDDDVTGPPAIVDGTVYVGSNEAGVLYALDADDGAERWRFPVVWRISNSVAIADGTLYLGSGEAVLYAID